MTSQRLQEQGSGVRGDEELALAFQQGDDSAFAELYERYFAALTAYLARRLPNGTEHEAEDLAEAAFVEVARRKERFDPKRGSFRSWLYKIASEKSCPTCASSSRIERKCFNAL